LGFKRDRGGGALEFGGKKKTRLGRGDPPKQLENRNSVASTGLPT